MTAVAPDDEGATILHVDMDAFFLSVELLDFPQFAGVPAAVAHDSDRSVITSASYEARRYGVRSAMAVGTARRLCPNLVLLEPHHEKYRAASQQVMQAFHEVTPLVEPLSIDEAFLDVAGARKLIGPPAVVGALLRERVRERTGLTCSVGVAGTKFVAKVASGKAKPDGLLVVPVARTLEFLHPLPVGALWGVGKASQERLERLGLRTVGDVAATPRAALIRALGEAGGAKLHDLSRGIDPRRVHTEREEKSVGHEHTFERDESDPELLRRELLRLADRTAERLRRYGTTGRTVQLKLRYADFRTVSRSRTLADPTSVGRRIYEEAVSLFDALYRPGDAIRLLGVRMEGLGEGAGLGLWEPDEEWRDAERAVDQVSARFGSGSVRPASLLGKGPRKTGDTRSLEH